MTHANYNRRFRSKKSATVKKPTHKFVCFQIGSVHYAIAIEQVQRILKEFTPFATLANGRSLVRYGEEVITLIALSQVFLSSASPTDYNYLIVCTLSQTEHLGFPVVEMPKVLEVTEDNFAEIPTAYRQQNIHHSVEKLIHIPSEKDVFCLNIKALI